MRPRRPKYDLAYINYQMLLQLKQITNYIKLEIEKEEQKRWMKDIIKETVRYIDDADDMNSQSKDSSSDDRYEQPLPQIQYKRYNRVFEDMNV